MEKRPVRFALGLALLTAVGGAASWVLVTWGPARSDLPRRPGQPAAWHEWLERNPPDQTIATLAGLLVYLVLAWLTLAVLASCATSLPGLGGRMAATTSAWITPVAVRRLVATALGVAVTASVAGPAAADTSWSGIDWPTSARTADSPPASPRVAPVPAAATPVLVAPVLVAPGDCLWDIAARTLGAGATAAQAAATWPRWYAANREVIGADPDVLQPGQRLQPPAG